MPDRVPIPYVESVEVVPPDEAEDMRAVIEALQQLLQHSREQTGRFQSDVHVKSHGIARGEFRVLPDLPDELAQGLFARAQSFPAVVRFSNAAPQPQSDLVPDGRGLALKLFDVDGERLDSDPDGTRTQDFLMVNHPVFVARNVKDYLRLEQVLVAAKDNPVVLATQGLTGGDWNPLRWHWREAVTVAQIATHLPAHPAGLTYFSMTPIRYGRYVAKYRVQPAGALPGSWVDLVTKLSTEPDALHQILAATLRSQELPFDFQIQLRTSAETMPVEDATIEWPETESPYRTVATLVLSRQELDGSRPSSSEPWAFNPWHALRDHQPLGGLNRLRRQVYPISANWRRPTAETPTV
jgi:catalase